MNSVLFAIRNHHGANLAVTLQDVHDSGLVLHSALGNHALPPLRVHKASGPADKSLIDFDVLSFAAKANIRAHVKAKSAIYSDALMSYMGLQEQGFAHQVVDTATTIENWRMTVSGFS